MDVHTFILGALSGVVIFALWPVVWLIVAVAAEILLNPSVAHAPEIDRDAERTRRELREARDDIDRLIREGEAHLEGH